MSCSHVNSRISLCEKIRSLFSTIDFGIGQWVFVRYLPTTESLSFRQIIPFKSPSIHISFIFVSASSYYYYGLYTLRCWNEWILSHILSFIYLFPLFPWWYIHLYFKKISTLFVPSSWIFHVANLQSVFLALAVVYIHPDSEAPDRNFLQVKSLKPIVSILSCIRDWDRQQHH